MNEMKELLLKEAKDKLAEANKQAVGSEEYEASVKSIAELVKAAENIDETEAKEKQMKSEAKHRWIDSGTKIAGVVASVAVPVGVAVIALKAEMKGILQTTEAGKASLRKCLNYVFKN